jgi:site-specific DNA-methyltransferase (adenine-specific)
MQTVYNGDCFSVIQEKNIKDIDLIYLDPPFGTQKEHHLSTRDGNYRFSYSDIWSSKKEYLEFLHKRITLFKQILKPTGSLFFHCDSTSSHMARFVLDDVFGEDNFRSEIIWHYKRWTNSQKNLIPAHQTILFYSKSTDYKFNTSYTDYSETTNVEQILHKRERDWRGKSIYAVDEDGDYIVNGVKKGVPLSDVWEIPYLNPKAKERVGYPTQKPITLLERIIKLASDTEDTILDPFCGSGTTLVAAALCDRNAFGIDISKEACELTQERLKNPTKTESLVMNLGRDKYLPKDTDVFRHLAGIDYTVVARNKGIDAILKKEINGRLVFIKIQRENELLSEAIVAITKATERKGACYIIVVKTHQSDELFEELQENPHLIVIPSFSSELEDKLTSQKNSRNNLDEKIGKMPSPLVKLLNTAHPTSKSEFLSQAKFEL